MPSKLIFTLMLALVTILSPAVFAQNSPSDLAASLGLDPAFPQAPGNQRGLGVSGDRVFRPGAQPAPGTQWCGDVAPELVMGGFQPPTTETPLKLCKGRPPACVQRPAV